MEPVRPGVRRYRCRTNAGRLVACTLRVEHGAVAEDGVALAWAASVNLHHPSWLESIEPGQYFVWRDEVYFASRDGSDPRENERRYTVLVPGFVAFLESQPLDAMHRLAL
jgi:hypothetical protein